MNDNLFNKLNYTVLHDSIIILISMSRFWSGPVRRSPQKIRTHAFTFLLFGLSTCSNGLVRDYYSRSRFRTPRYKTPLFHVHFCVDNTVECRMGIFTLSGLMPRASEKKSRSRKIFSKKKKKESSEEKEKANSVRSFEVTTATARARSERRETRERREEKRRET